MNRILDLFTRFNPLARFASNAQEPAITLEHIEENRPISTKTAFWSSIAWGRILTWFLRISACLWLAKGILSWMTIIGVNGTFEGRSLTFQATVVYFAVLDLVAAVGLWLLSTWGGVLWLLAVMSHVTLAFFFPKIVPLNTTVLAGFGVMIMLYILLSWQASREEF